MIPTKGFILIVLALVYAKGSSLHGDSEKTPPKSEIMLRIKRLLQMLREKEQDTVARDYEPRAIKHHSLISERKRMLERRKKLEYLLEMNPGLRTLLKAALEKRKKKEKLLNDPQHPCLPGIFYCRDESLNERLTRKRAALKKMLQKKQRDSNAYCPPGFFYCPENSDESDESQKQEQDRLDILDDMFPKRKSRTHQRTREMEDLDAIVRLANKKRESQDHRVEVLRIPASVKKVEESDEARKAAHGEGLADDLVKSLQDTGKQNEEKKSEIKETSNFDLKQLVDLLKE